MIKHWLTIYVILLCSYPSSLFSNDLLIFRDLMINKRVDQDLQTFYHSQYYDLVSNSDKNPIYQKTDHHLQHQSDRGSIERILEYSRKFRKLNFSLQQEQLKVLAYDVRDLYRENKIGMFFISAYFIRACELLQIQKTSPIEIAKIIKRKIKQLMNITSIQTYRRQRYNEESLYSHPSFWKQAENMVVPITYKKIRLGKQNKNQQVQDIIMHVVQQARQKYELFNFITSQGCRLNNGLSYHINYKIERRSQLHQMKRIKQKLFRNYLNIYGQKCQNTFFNIASKRKMQQIGFQELLNKIYGNLQELEFVVKDILRAKCMFNKVQDILSTIKTIKQVSQRLNTGGHNIRIVQFENRLNKTTCDIVLVLQIDQLSYEIQLTLQFDEALFQISHKMYELSRSKVFSPIVLLFNWFQKSAPQFLYKIGQFLVQNSQYAQSNQNIKSIQKQNSNSLLKQYELLNNFFHLTSYHDLNHVSGEQFQKQITQEIVRTSSQIKQPIINYLTI